jgi:hypothetical protein
VAIESPEKMFEAHLLERRRQRKPLLENREKWRTPFLPLVEERKKWFTLSWLKVGHPPG